MNSRIPTPAQCAAALLLTLLGVSGIAFGPLAPRAAAYPPAPHHLFYGMVRDELGNPITVTNATIILETTSGMQLTTTIVPYLEPSMNYRLAVPLDSGITSDLYKPTALRPTVPFRIKVKIGSVTYLPIEMSANLALMGQPGQRTRLDLTLGEDSDGDGIPDAWQRAIIALSGGRLNSLSDVKPNDDFDGDGLTNLQEYLAGTYAFDSKDGFVLNIARMNGGSPVLEFMAIRGRTYAVMGSPDLKEWTQLEFKVSVPNADGATMRNYAASDVRLLQVEPGQPAGSAPMRFFKLMAQ
jgi:hypothetical protein